MTPSTRVSEANLSDLLRIRHEVAWLYDHLPDLHVIAMSQRHQQVEQVQSHAHVSSGPVLSERYNPQLRDKLTGATKRLKHMATEIAAIRVALEKHLDEQAYDSSLIGTLLEPGELEAARKAKQRRDQNAGDYRWGEWEATPDKQPGARFK